MKQSLVYLRLGAFVSAILAAALQVTAVLTLSVENSNYFANGAAPTFAAIFALLGVALGTACTILTPRRQLAASPFAKTASRAPIAIGFLAPAVLLPFSSASVNPLIPIIASVSLAIGVLYGIFSNLPFLRKHQNTTALFGFAAVIGSIALNAYYYFDTSIEMNAPIKVTTQMGLLCVTVYLTGELRYLLERPMPRMFSALTFWLVSVGALSSLSVPVAYFMGITDRADYAAGAALVLCVLLTALARTATVMRAAYTPTSSEQSENAPPLQ